MLEKTYDPKSAEPRIAKAWENANAFAAGAGAKHGAEPYSIVIPPPNVTGSLHMGHALNNTLQDILIRFERMRGRDVLWQPGTDHAGIATQMVVERQLAAAGNEGRREMGREKFIDRVWQWKGESGGVIVNQLKRLGASCDWSRERFTMDEGLSKAVLEVFVTLYKQGLIYRGKRLVNWDPHFETAISDLEVENREVAGHMWHFKYPLAGGATYEHVEKDADGNVTLRETRDYISIATTRPETMLGDGAVAVHPSDARYQPIIGKLCEIPVGPKAQRRLIPIITDDYPDPDFGSGAVKITGAHDFNDYQVARRNGIPMYRLMDTKGAMRTDGEDYAAEAAKAEAIRAAEGQADEAMVDAINIVPDAYRGLDRFEARKRVIADIDAEGLMIKVEDKVVMQPFGDRSNVVIEPMLTDQWFCDAATLAKPAIASVREGRTKFVPEAWEKTYFQWMENIEPWCISRQLWWGHRIPAWYGPDGTVFVERDEEEALNEAIQHYLALEGPWKAWVQDKLENFQPGDILSRDEDVLDTWFSSALWPFSTLGWPDNTPELKKYYQTDVLVTGFDIIFFWVARMMMMGLHFMKDADGNPVEPFHTVYVHALVRDKDGQKMSKSKGNVIDPLDLIDEYGADALRFTLAIMAAQGRDVKLDPARIAGYRNFGTKLWNATRFAEMNGALDESQRMAGFMPQNATLTVNRWVLTELSAATAEITKQIEAYRFNDAAAAAYRFVWNTVCDWYLELLKPVFFGDNEAEKAECHACMAHVLDRIYALLHPFMPFMTEELWAVTAGEGGRKTLLIHSEWPRPDFDDLEAAAEINWLIEVVTGLRSARSEMNVPPSAQAELVAVGADAQARDWFTRHEAALGKLARVTRVSFADDAPKGSAQIVAGGATLCLPLGQLIDFAAETARLQKALARNAGEAEKIEKKLGNAQFVANAPDAVVTAERERLAELQAQTAGLEAALARLAQASGA
ncbi:MAG: valine--tRNA ligase [Rhizobiaceae bacterium]|jgi:valyl-tRNA synthetase|nr:valine--tRNA ligase [Rhizobiaceae bacterium]